MNAENKNMPTEDLTTILSRCATLLQQAGESFWSQKIQKILLDTNSDLTLRHLNEILSWYGGMGSFNDVILSQINGHDMDDLEEDDLNARLDQLRETIYNEATAKRRQLQSAPT